MRPTNTLSLSLSLFALSFAKRPPTNPARYLPPPPQNPVSLPLLQLGTKSTSFEKKKTPKNGRRRFSPAAAASPKRRR